jgi:hypothetical protein
MAQILPIVIVNLRFDLKSSLQHKVLASTKTCHTCQVQDNIIVFMTRYGLALVAEAQSKALLADQFTTH